MKKFKRIIALFLAVCMIASTPLSALAAQPAAAQSEETFSKVLHLDNGRKYFSKDWIIALVNEMEAAGYNQLQLAFGNDGMRFLLDDMSVTVNGTTYSTEVVTAGIKAGNKAYYDAGEVNELTQAEMTEIVNYAKSKGIEVVPHMNMPGHMDAILDAIEYAGISNAHFTGNTTSVRSLNLNNTDAVDFTLALLEKYVAYFDDLGCQYFHIGADEFGNDAYGSSMGFPSMGTELYAKFAKFVNDAAGIVKDAGMTPRAWNDGISYTKYSANFDKDIQITYWSSGWSGYNVASASTLSGNGHDMINTNGDYYFILKSDSIQNPTNSALNFDNNTFMGSTISDPVGSMFCIWCDAPGSATEQETAEAVRITLRKMAAAMNDTKSYSEEVVPGGFNEDGSINDSRQWNDVSAEGNSDIIVSGYDLTRVETVDVAETELPSIDNAAKTMAWDITPYVGTEKYIGEGTVSLPVPAEWNTAKIKGFYIEGGEVILVEGVYADGKYIFDMPHFSVAGIVETAYDKLIELNVGESKNEIIEGVNLTGEVFNPTPEGVANITTELSTVPSGKTLERVESAVDIVSGDKYVLVNQQSGNVLGDTTSNSGWNTYLVQENEEVSENSTAWTITKSGENYLITNSNGEYMTIGRSSTNLSNDANSLTIHDYKDGTFAIGQSNYYWTYYLNNVNNGQYAGSNTTLDNAGNHWELYRIVDRAGSNGTKVTFMGRSIGQALVTINNVVYKIIVHGKINITINYKDTEGTIIKTETVEVQDTATNYHVSGFSYGDKFYAVSENILNITPTTTTSYDVIVIETEDDLSTVDPLTIYFWITNQKVPIDGEPSMSLDAADVHSENGMKVSDIVPVSNKATDNPKTFWRGWLLPEGYHQLPEGTDMCTDSHGVQIERIRYWNKQWSYFDGSQWKSIKDTDQVDAYYLQQTQITKEVTTSVTDWSYNYNQWKKNEESWFWTGYVQNGSKYVFLDFAVVYEDGTQTPESFPVDETWFFHFDGHSASNPRVLKPIAFTETSEYEIWKVTVTDGSTEGRSYQSANTFETSYDDASETVVWDESMGGTPHIEDLTYTQNTSGKLVRIYVRAVETEDTLTVVYRDEKFKDTLYSYNISVPNGDNFNDDIVNLSTGNVEDPGMFTGNSSRLDVTGYGIVNTLQKTQTFQTDLTLVPEAVGKYNNGLYTYTGSEIKDEGKTLYLYYNIDTEALSPMFVADYGRPFTFELSKVVGNNQDTMVKDVTVNEKTRYGTLSYDADKKEFTYTPTQVLPNIDVLTINIKFDGDSSFTTTNAGVLPATTVDYEEGLATLTGFINGSKGTTMQNAWVAGTNPEKDVYGYDSKIVAGGNTVAKSTAKGNTAEFAFTGTGVDLYVNSTDSSGHIGIQVRNAVDNRLVKVIGVQTSSYSTITEGFSNTEQRGLIAASVSGLEHGQYTVKLITTDDTTTYFDGFRVYGTMQDQTNDYYKGDLEDNPTFVELRNNVLAGLNVATGEITEDNPSGSIYAKDIAETTIAQVYATANSTAGGIVLDKDTSSSFNAQQLLDNGPKNELFLLPGQSVVFKLTTAREVQVGMKAVNGTAKVTGSYNGTITSERDMFYTVVPKSDEAEKTVTITNDSSSTSILSITKVKICDDPNATFGELEADDLIPALGTLGYKTESAEPTPEPGTPDPQPGTPTPEPGTPDPEPGTPDPQPGTPTPEPDPEPGVPTPEPGEPSHKCKMKEDIKPATTTKNGKIVIKCKECGEVESTTVIYKASNVKLSKNEFVYNGKVKSPKLTIKDSKGNTIAKKYYSVSKPAGRKDVGKYTYTIKFKGLYEGTKKLTLTVKPKATFVKKVTASKKAFTVKWNKVSKQATGYEIMYATNAKFSKGKKTVKVTKLNTTSKKISKLKAKQKYYVKVRTYKTVKVNGKKTNIYSAWSSPKTITVKK